jgi:large subunit ribosomal protein L18
MSVERDRRRARRRRQLRGRRRAFGTAERPRLCVTKTLRHLHAQIIDDVAGHTIAAASTLDPELRAELNGTCNMAAAQAVGASVAKKALEKGIRQVIFDRGGFPYHGKIRALAESAREAGLKF